MNVMHSLADSWLMTSAMLVFVFLQPHPQYVAYPKGGLGLKGIEAIMKVLVR